MLIAVSLRRGPRERLDTTIPSTNGVDTLILKNVILINMININKLNKIVIVYMIDTTN